MVIAGEIRWVQIEKTYQLQSNSLSEIFADFICLANSKKLYSLHTVYNFNTTCKKEMEKGVYNEK